jgi:AcrR family transcriptional regulator
MLHRITTLGETRCSSPQNHLSTKDRLLEAGLRVFAERGFHGASIRDICRHAQTNVAAVHYYFHGKEKLHRAVIEHAIQSLAAQFAAGSEELVLKASAQRRRGRIQPVIPLPIEDHSLWPIRLIVRQLVEPGPACDYVVEVLRTHATQLEGPLRRCFGPRTEAQLVEWCALNLFCQYLFFCASQAAFGFVRNRGARPCRAIHRSYYPLCHCGFETH